MRCSVGHEIRYSVVDQPARRIWMGCASHCQEDEFVNCTIFVKILWMSESKATMKKVCNTVVPFKNILMKVIHDLIGSANISMKNQNSITNAILRMKEDAVLASGHLADVII